MQVETLLQSNTLWPAIEHDHLIFSAGGHRRVVCRLTGG